MKTHLKNFRILAGAGALALILTASPAPAAVSSDVATRPGGNVSEQSIPRRDGGDTPRGQMDKAKYNSRTVNKSSSGDAYTSLSVGDRKPVGGSLTGGSPDHQSTRDMAPLK